MVNANGLLAEAAGFGVATPLAAHAREHTRLALGTLLGEPAVHVGARHAEPPRAQLSARANGVTLAYGGLGVIDRIAADRRELRHTPPSQARPREQSSALVQVGEAMAGQEYDGVGKLRSRLTSTMSSSSDRLQSTSGGSLRSGWPR